MSEKVVIKMEGLPPFSEEDLYFVRKLISHLVPDSYDLIRGSGWSEACKEGIERLQSLNNNYFHNANLYQKKNYDSWLPDDDTDF
jgi:hypothetical protein